MKVIAIHDSAGIISSIITCEEGPHPVMTLPPGFSMTEVQPPEELAEIDLKTSEGVTILIESYRVEVAPAAKVALVPR
jgi:hypothetical protein